MRRRWSLLIVIVASGCMPVGWGAVASSGTPSARLDRQALTVGLAYARRTAHWDCPSADRLSARQHNDLASPCASYAHEAVERDGMLIRVGPVRIRHGCSDFFNGDVPSNRTFDCLAV